MNIRDYTGQDSRLAHSRSLRHVHVRRCCLTVPVEDRVLEMYSEATTLRVRVSHRNVESLATRGSHRHPSGGMHLERADELGAFAVAGGIRQLSCAQDRAVWRWHKSVGSLTEEAADDLGVALMGCDHEWGCSIGRGKLHQRMPDDTFRVRLQNQRDTTLMASLCR